MISVIAGITKEYNYLGHDDPSKVLLCFLVNKNLQSPDSSQTFVIQEGKPNLVVNLEDMSWDFYFGDKNYKRYTF